MDGKIDALLMEIRACRVCAAALPLGPRPVIQAGATARLLIVSQAPGTRAHRSGLSFDDRSGDRLRDWLGIDRACFYDRSRIAIMAMGLCYPGVDGKGGDRPPRPECAPLWHPRLLPLLTEIRLTLLVGAYALRRYAGRASEMAEAIRHGIAGRHELLALPHPSWRNTGWLRRYPWFEAETLPALRTRIRALFAA